MRLLSTPRVPASSARSLRAAQGAAPSVRAIVARVCAAALLSSSAHFTDVALAVGLPSMTSLAYLELDIADAEANMLDKATRLADTSYPVLTSLSAPTFAPFEARLAGLVRAADPAAVAKTAALGRDALQSLPPPQLDALKTALGGSAAECRPLPKPAALLEALGAAGIGEEVQAVLSPLPKSGGGEVCLPPLSSLEKAAAALASADPDRIVAFNQQATTTWAGAAKAPAAKAAELKRLRIDVMQRVDLAERKAFTSAARELAEAAERWAGVRQASRDGPPKESTLAGSDVSRDMYERGVIYDDALVRKGWVKKRCCSSPYLLRPLSQ